MPQCTWCLISNSKKAALRAQNHLKPSLSDLHLQKWFEETYKQPIDPSTVSRVLSPRFVFLDTLHTHQLSDKRRRTEQWPELDQTLFEWIQRAEGQITILQEVIREKARKFWPVLYPEEMPQFSNGWLYGFRSRRNIRRNAQYDEAGGLSENAAAEMVKTRQALST